MTTVTSQTLKLFNKNNLNKNLQVTVNNNDVGISSGILPINLYCEHLKVYQTDGLSSQNLLQDIDVIRKDNILLRKDINLIISKFNAVLSNDKFPEEWVSGNYYGVRTFVTHDDKIYILCNTQLTSNLPPSNNNSGWIPVWDSNKSYSPDTVVFYENKLYIWASNEELSPLNISPSLGNFTYLGNFWDDLENFGNQIQMWSNTDTYIMTENVPVVLYYGGLYIYSNPIISSVAGISPIDEKEDWSVIWSKSRRYSYGDVVYTSNGKFVYRETPDSKHSTRGVVPVNNVDGWISVPPQEWVSGNQYHVRNFVKHNDHIYILCNPQLQSDNQPSNNNSGWIEVWDSNKSYSPDTVVFYENKLYTWFSYEELSPLNISPSLNIMTSLGNVWFNLSVQMWSSTSTYSQSISLPFVLYYGGLYGYKASTQSIVGSSPITDTDDWVPIWSKSRTYSNGDILIARNGIFAYTEPNINSTRGVEPVNGEDGWNCIFPF